MKSNIVLIGFMGTGKSTIGRKLAQKLNMYFIDTDKEIEKVEQKSITQIFSLKGEKHFRTIESNVISKISNRTNVVIATGGGAVLNPRNIDNLRKFGTIICLKASIETILKNVSYSTKRPLLSSKDLKNKINDLLLIREQYYNNNDFEIDVSSLSIDEIVKKIISMRKI